MRILFTVGSKESQNLRNNLFSSYENPDETRYFISGVCVCVCGGGGGGGRLFFHFFSDNFPKRVLETS